MFATVPTDNFWKRVGRKYTASPISDTAGDERTPARTSALLSSDDSEGIATGPRTAGRRLRRQSGRRAPVRHRPWAGFVKQLIRIAPLLAAAFVSAVSLWLRGSPPVELIELAAALSFTSNVLDLATEMQSIGHHWTKPSNSNPNQTDA